METLHKKTRPSIFCKKRSKDKISIIRILIMTMILANLFSCCSMSKKTPSDHFDGARYHNKEKDSHHSLTDMIKWMWEMKTVDWPEWIEDPPQPKPEASVADGKIRATFINHATVLIQADGLNILTDPIWSKRAGPFSWLGTKRVRKPGVDMEDLPPIDIVLLSHDHYDHCDLPTLTSLFRKRKFLMISGMGMRKLLGEKGIDNVVELDWWQSFAIPNSEMKITFVPAMHDSGRSLFYGRTRLWGGFVIQANKGNIYFAGDTGYGEFFDELHKRFPRFALTILPVGNYEKRWIMKNQHMNPGDAVKAHLMLKSKQSMGMHYATFNEHPEQTIVAHEKDLKKALAEYGLPESAFWLLKFGEGKDLRTGGAFPLRGSLR